MRIAIFTLCTKDFLPNSIVCLNSAKKHLPTEEHIETYCFVVDKKFNRFFKYNCEIVSLFCEEENYDYARWINKPKILKLLLQDFDIVFYVDPDIFFVKEAKDILNETNKGILLTKHNRPIYPSNDNFDFGQFMCLFSEGFFNAGFIGASKEGLKAIGWWQSMVDWKCCKNKSLGLYDDQKYLDILALEYSESVNISKNLGYNVAHWNIKNLNRNTEIIFYHFSGGENMQKIDQKLFSSYMVYISNVNKVKETCYA